MHGGGGEGHLPEMADEADSERRVGSERHEKGCFHGLSTNRPRHGRELDMVLSSEKR